MAECKNPEKVPYASQSAAEHARRGLYANRKAGSGRVVVYPCGGHWHVGHKQPKSIR
jgi:hypothetical protein